MPFGRLLFRFRNPIAAVPMVYALFSTRGEWEDTIPEWFVAIALAALGVWMRAWATCHCRYSTGEKKRLATTGPYAYIRNPLYVGNILIILGAVVASELAWLLPVAMLWALAVYSAVARYESIGVQARFGDEYLRYRSSVPAWIPVRWRIPPPAVAVEQRVLRAFVRQAGNFVWLLPFVLKELHVFGLGGGN